MQIIATDSAVAPPATRQRAPVGESTGISPDEESSLPAMAVELAAAMLRDGLGEEKWSERLQGRKMARLMDDAPGKAFTFSLADELFRPPTLQRRARRFRDLVREYEIPEYLAVVERLAMLAGHFASYLAPDLVMKAVEGQLRRESTGVILSAEPKTLHRHIAKRAKQDIRINLNQLGEAVLGEEEARHRLDANLAWLADPAVNYISVKISAIFSQIHLVAREETLVEIKKRLRELYRAAMRTKPSKFVNLDMEEYRDLHLTCEAFREVLEEEEFHELEAGIVLQAYLPDSWPVQKDLNAWARRRVAAGGAGIKIRIVKGANLAMEKVDSGLHDWPLAPYGSKTDVDANFKRMVREGCRPENAKGVRLGIASHNLLDIAYALLVREQEGVEDRVEFEMLEGMANHQARVTRDIAGGLLIYAPVVRREDFPAAIAYLIRRLDENTAPENFLHDLFGMKPGDAAWHRQVGCFTQACHLISSLPHGPNRRQNRATEQRPVSAPDAGFHNEADTDWSLSANVAWVREKVARQQGEKVAKLPLQVAGELLPGSDETVVADPSRPDVEAYRHALAGPAEIERALQCAVSARQAWLEMGFDGRGELLLKAAALIAACRGDAIASMVMDAGKSVMEADVEISEAVDFAEYYARAFTGDWFDGVGFEPLGTVLVTPPWNFPFAIPCGGVLAALVAGNTVILKPAPETVLTAWVMVNALWDAGIPREVLQFLPCPDNGIGQSLVTDSRVGAVVLTGASETARMFLGWKPEMRLLAETSGKNALIVTAAADPDLAAKDLVKSAFGHAGQKCSAASLCILEAEVYDDPAFHQKLRDAAASLKVGGSWDYSSIVTPVVREPGDALAKALTTLEEGEEWLLEPRMVDHNPCLWSPGIKLGVTPGSWFHRTECFGPVLGLMRADDLGHAIDIQNSSDFGLTGGIHSLDPVEVALWREKVQVGNAYINRPITGAIVRRQPFGGWKRSACGPGAKAGGPNYASQFGIWKTTGLPANRARPGQEVRALLPRLVSMGGNPEYLMACAGSDAWWMEHEFSIEHDPSGLACESNVFRYRVFDRVLLRIPDMADVNSAGRMFLAAVASGAHVEISIPEDARFLAWNGMIHFESEAELAARLVEQPGFYGVLRSSGASAELAAAAATAGVRLSDHEPVSNGRIEMLPWFREQAISETLHRHGSIRAHHRAVNPS